MAALACNPGDRLFGANLFRPRHDKTGVIAQGIAGHEFARASRPPGVEHRPCPPHRRGGDPERGALYRAVDHDVQHGHVAADRSRMLRRDRGSKFGVGHCRNVLDAVSTVIFSVVAVIAAIFSIFDF